MSESVCVCVCVCVCADNELVAAAASRLKPLIQLCS